MHKLKYGIVYSEYHSYKHISYLYSKVEKLKPFIDEIVSDGNGFLLKTIPLRELEDMYYSFYPKGNTCKQVPDWIIDDFNTAWLGYWYLEKGSFLREETFISNHLIDKNHYKLLQKKLKENSILVTIPKKGKRFIIQRGSLKKFYDIVLKYITPDMLYKIEERYRPCVSTFTESEEVTLREQWDTLYDRGFPYPSLTEKHWDNRFRNLIKFEGTYKHRENSVLLATIFYRHMYDHLHKIYNDKEKVISNRIKYADRVTPASLLTGLKLLSKETRTNFSPLIAKMSINKLCNKPCNILDYSMGFGGRLLGIMSAKEKHNYFGIDPWLKNHESAENLLDAMSRTIPDVWERTETFCQGSEDYIPILKNKIDIAFSSPPYFNYERYTPSLTQCYIKYPKYQSWLIGYWENTVKNIKRYLKPGGLFCLNIKDVKKISLEKDMSNIIIKHGFELINTQEYVLTGRMSNFNKLRKEPIFIFKKL